MKFRYSLQTKITIIFCVAIVAVCLIGIGAHIKSQRESAFEFYHLAVSMAVSEDSRDETDNRFNVEKFIDEGFLLVTNKKQRVSVLKIYDKLLLNKKRKNGKDQKHYKDTDEERMGKIYFSENGLDFGIILYDDNGYLVLSQEENERIIFQIPNVMKNYTALFIFGGIVLLLCLLYMATIRSIRPLKTLRERIKDFAEGNDEIEIKIRGDDEIAAVINEFDVAIKKIRAFRQARQLFLRNIMHEFKTPIMQGKLSVEMLDESMYKKSLEKVFIRQENLLNRFISIEKLSSGELGLDIHAYNLRDIVDASLDIIGEQASNIRVKIEDKKVQADFDMLAIAIKNLLDNALLYSSDKKAYIGAIGDEIFISNVGKPLEFPLEEYKKPFFMQGKKQKESRGLGFGLFISLNIFDLHEIQTKYEYENGRSIFTLKFNL
ncbi:MAG: ArsS family sensor histidine kinase [Campylobacteraceae bacterium]|jgi:two-component system OmpR family sensor kinase|nr:ArsS family sensor histidine kinase [Campylobacteraceae bacterium]